MLLGLVVAQLFGIQQNTREINSRIKYASSPDAATEEFAIFVFFVYVALGTVLWPVAPIMKIWRTGSKAGAITLAFLAFIFFIAGLPIYLIFGFCWSVIKFGMTYL